MQNFTQEEEIQDKNLKDEHDFFPFYVARGKLSNVAEEIMSPHTFICTQKQTSY